MRSRVDEYRLFLERLLRVVSIALIAAAIWWSIAPLSERSTARAASGRVLLDSLAAWTVDPDAESLHVAFDGASGRTTREWLVALRRAGAHVGWSSEALSPLALTVEPLNDPLGGARALIAAPARATVSVADELTLVDTVRLAAPAAEVRVAGMHGLAVATLGAQVARAAARDSLDKRDALVLGSAGWEAKFVMAALEERGWRVAARLHVAPGVEVTQGAPPLDTSRVGVVIALDSTAAREAARIARFVRGGGGLVLAGPAARSPEFASLAAGRTGARVPAASIVVADTAPRRALGYFPIVTLARGAVVLERRDGQIVAAARRVDAGRVVQVGYDDTWRWRFLGGDDAPRSHRDWWSAVAGGAAHRAARAMTIDSMAVDPAPLAATFAALGAPVSPATAERTPPAAYGLRPWLLALIMLSLLGEWASRRLRGAP